MLNSKQHTVSTDCYCLTQCPSYRLRVVLEVLEDGAQNFHDLRLSFPEAVNDVFPETRQLNLSTRHRHEHFAVEKLFGYEE